MRHHCLARSKFLCCKFSKKLPKANRFYLHTYFFQYFSSICAAPLPEPIAGPPLPPPHSTLSASYHMCPHAPTPSPPFPPASLSFFPSYYLHPHSPYSHTLTNMNGSDPPIRMYGFFPPSYSTSVILPMYIHFPWVFIICFCSFLKDLFVLFIC